LNGGTCVDGVNSYECDCAGTGYNGVTCNSNIDECASSPCLHGGTCADGINSYECDCYGTGYNGVSCNSNIDDCSASTCLNGGTCADGVNSYLCSCTSSWTNTTCETRTTACSSSPCQNSGICSAGCSYGSTLDFGDGHHIWSTGTTGYYSYNNGGGFDVDFQQEHHSISFWLYRARINVADYVLGVDDGTNSNINGSSLYIGYNDANSFVYGFQNWEYILENPHPISTW
jgi:hypothetical protein